MVRRNLASCAEHAKTVTGPNVAPFIAYAKYTLHVTNDQLESVEKIWFPVFSEYDSRFSAQTIAHAPLKEKVSLLNEMLTTENTVESNLPKKIADTFTELRNEIEIQYDIEEDLSNWLGRRVPLDRIKAMEKQQEERRKGDVKTYGHLWTAVYMLRSLNPKERAIFPPGIPKFVASGMLTAGAMQFRKYVPSLVY